jgi:hypothetical protein
VLGPLNQRSKLLQIGELGLKKVDGDGLVIALHVNIDLS